MLRLPFLLRPWPQSSFKSLPRSNKQRWIATRKFHQGNDNAPLGKKRFFRGSVGILVGGATVGALAWYTSSRQKELVDQGEQINTTLSPWQLQLAKRIPFRFTSYCWGKLTHIHLPVWLRGPIYKSYSWLFSCNLDEMRDPIESYASLAEFFSRRLKTGIRPLSNGMISPVDGKILYHGEVQDDMMEQVKGIKYSLPSFLGSDIKSNIKLGPNRKLYYYIIYLAPGDYHGIHSPIDWTIYKRRHFPGYLFPVAPFVANLIQGLFALNERVCLYGKWEHGFLCVCPVGASNVGSISVLFDADVKTNTRPKPREEYLEKSYDGIRVKKGEEISFFHLGSTVVVLFESPDFEFVVKPGDTVKLGQSLGSFSSQRNPSLPA